MYKASLSVSILMVGFVVGLNAQPNTNAVPVTPELIESLMRTARSNNPGLSAAAARVDAATHNADAVRAWADPTVSLGKMAAPRDMMREEGDVVLEIEQTLPLFGKEKLQREVARAGTQVETARAFYQDHVLRRDLTLALVRSALAQRESEIGAAELQWIDLIATTAQQRYALGTSAQTDVLRLQTELARRSDELRSTTNNLARERFVLNRILNLPLEESFPRLDLPEPAPPLPATPALINFASQADPQTKVMRQQIREAEATTKLTRRQRLPDVFVGAEATRYSGDGRFTEGMVKVGLNLPWFNSRRYGSDIKREEARVRAAELDLDDYALELRDQILRQTTAIDNSRRSALVYQQQIIPRAEQSLRSALANWEANRGSFIDLLDTRRTLLEAQFSAARAVAEQHEALSELVLLLGVNSPEHLQKAVAQSAAPSSTPSKP